MRQTYVDEPFKGHEKVVPYPFFLLSPQTGRLQHNVFYMSRPFLSEYIDRSKPHIINMAFSIFPELLELEQKDRVLSYTMYYSVSYEDPVLNELQTLFR